MLAKYTITAASGLVLRYASRRYGLVLKKWFRIVFVSITPLFRWPNLLDHYSLSNTYCRGVSFTTSFVRILQLPLDELMKDLPSNAFYLDISGLIPCCNFAGYSLQKYFLRPTIYRNHHLPQMFARRSD